MEEKYQNKYNMVFEKGSNCIVMNDPQFHQPVTLTAGQTKGLPPTSKKVKEAIEAIDREGLLTDDTLWWAIYRVLTMEEFGYPIRKSDFCRTIENLQLQVTRRCKYDNWRNVSVHHLASDPGMWQDIENLTEAESRQRRVGIRLLELLRA